MGNAGRVLMIPKGEYNAATTYEMLDFVYYNGRSYVCKQTSTGNVPTNTTYWQALTGDASAEIQALTNEVNTMNNVLGAKNLLPNTAVSTTSGGLTITKNDDGSIHISGTRSSGGDYYYQINNAPVIKDTNNYILSGITGGSSTTYQMVVQDFVNNTNLGISYDGDRSFSATANGVKVFIVVRSGQTIDKTFYPMIRPASITDTTYEPYAKTNAELTADVSEIKGGISLGGYFTGNIDTINNQYGYMYSVDKSKASGTYPTGSGSVFLLMGFSAINSSDNVVYGVQIALSFTTSTIHIRHFDYTAGGGTWGAWSQIS